MQYPQHEDSSIPGRPEMPWGGFRSRSTRTGLAERALRVTPAGTVTVTPEGITTSPVMVPLLEVTLLHDVGFFPSRLLEASTQVTRAQRPVTRVA